jgi:hypothetical protein
VISYLVIANLFYECYMEVLKYESDSNFNNKYATKAFWKEAERRKIDMGAVRRKGVIKWIGCVSWSGFHASDQTPNYV